MRRESGTSGPYSVERPQDRDTYQDGDRGLTELWRDRPYSDVEQPKADPCPDKDAEDADISPKRLRWEEVARAAAKDAADDGAAAEKKEYESDSDLAFGSPLWTRVAPLVDGVLNAMYENDSRDKLESNLSSKGVSNLRLVMDIVEKAEHTGFGYRYTQKVWDNFLTLVPLCGNLKQSYNRKLASDALGKLGVENHYKFDRQPQHMGFKQKTYGSGMLGGDPQEVYEERVPGHMPSLETKNVERWLKLHSGDGLDEMADDAWEKIINKKIVDPKTGRFSKHRLQSMLRYAYEMPDSDLARAIIVAIMLRDAMRIVASDGAALSSALSGGESGLSAGSLASGLQEVSKGLVDKWLDIAISTMHYVGVLPGADADPDDADEVDDPVYGLVRDTMRQNLASMAVNLANQLFKSVGKQTEGGAPAVAAQPDYSVPSAAKALAEATRKAVAAAVAATAEDAAVPDTVAVKSALGALNVAAKAGDGTAMQSAAEAIASALYSIGVVPGSPEFTEIWDAVGRLGQAIKRNKAASSTVAELVKRILSPARSRVVDQSEAEDGIELEDGQELVLPSRYHSVSQALGGSACRFR